MTKEEFKHVYIIDSKEGEVKVYSTEKIDENEAAAYVDRGQHVHFFGKYLDKVYLKIDGDEVDIEYVPKRTPGFDRIRRITGYLVGTLDRFNDGKRAEESERVKHRVGN